MLQAKWIIADLFGFSAAFLGWINNLDTVKSTLLFIVGFTYTLARLYFYVRKGLHEIKKQEREEDDWNRRKSA